MKIGFFNDWQPGVVKGNHIVDITNALKGVHAHHPQELINVIIEYFDEFKGDIEKLAAKTNGVPLDSVTILPPVPRPEKLICMAVNYLEGENPAMPEIDAFLKASDTVIGDGDTVLLDPECKATIFHHEAELAVVIAKEADHVKQQAAMDYVFGYTGFMDVSARGFNPRGAQSYYQAKSWRTFGPMGPFIVTKDEIPDPHNVNVRLSNNYFKFPGYNTRDMAHKIPECIEFASRIMTLQPGDIISTGTNHQNLGAMQEGDLIVMDIDHIGPLHVKVHDPLAREWPRGIDEAMARRMRGGGTQTAKTFDKSDDKK
ncbi:MAG: fumarylacetoacetate hydrolase family protein [SAR202 cluster bacterium]|nr:fumarylacetoacetate hydrolase family protein [SAR202 cluster bacterium]